jgi:Domain of unknown function (DUF4351)
MPKEIDHDQLFKKLISTFFVEFLDLFAPELASYIDRQSVEFLPQEIFTDIIEGEQRIMDLVARVKLNRRPNEPDAGKVSVIINCEHESSSIANFDRRLFFYFAQLYREYLEPVYPIVIYSFDAPKKKKEGKQHQVKLPGLKVLEFNYLTIQLNQLDWQDFLKQQNPVAAALMAKMKIDPVDRAKVKLECLRAIVTLKLDPARVALLSWFVDTYLTLNQIEEVEFREKVDKIKPKQQKEQVMQMVTSWMEQGIEQGEERVALRMVQRSLLRRFGEVAPAVDQQLKLLSVQQLEELHDAAYDFSEVSDLLNWLDQNRPVE